MALNYDLKLRLYYDTYFEFTEFIVIKKQTFCEKFLSRNQARNGTHHPQKMTRRAMSHTTQAINMLWE